MSSELKTEELRKLILVPIQASVLSPEDGWAPLYLWRLVGINSVFRINRLLRESDGHTR